MAIKRGKYIIITIKLCKIMVSKHKLKPNININFIDWGGWRGGGGTQIMSCVNQFRYNIHSAMIIASYCNIPETVYHYYVVVS